MSVERDGSAVERLLSKAASNAKTEFAEIVNVKRPRGRPAAECTQEIADKIAERLASGESLRQICRDPSMPCRSVVQKWVRDLPSFAVQYARACEAREDDTFDEIIEISDNPEIEPDRARVMIDARKWSLARMAPKKYGDVQRHVGADGGAIEVRHTRKLDISGLTDEQLDALEVALSGTVLQLEAEKTEE